MMQTYTTEEQKKHRKALVAALRSEDYEQSTSSLRNRQGYCCLGVACDISELGAWEPPQSNPTEPDLDLEFAYQVHIDDGHWYFNSWHYLPDPVREYYGFRHPSGEFRMDEAVRLGLPHCSLLSLNDEGVPFAEIADIIEQEPDGLIYENPSPIPLPIE